MLNSARVRHGREVRRVQGHGRKVLSSIVGRSVLILIVVGDLVVAPARRWSRRASGRCHLDDEGFVNRLAAGIVGVERGADRFFGAQGTLQRDVFVSLFATDDFQSNVGSVDAAAE